jgi:hypothetical protein
MVSWALVLSTILVENDSVLEIRPAEATIVACLGPESAWRALDGDAGAAIFRVAEDERWLVGSAEQRDHLMQAADRCARAVGATALAVDVTDAWAVCSVIGDEAHEAWTRVSENPLPRERPGFVQGSLATIPGKTIVQERRLDCFTPSPLGHHLPRRLLEACADLGAQLLPATRLMVGGHGPTSFAEAGPAARAGT